MGSTTREHGSEGEDGAGRSLRERLRHLFRERELLIRSDDRVRYFRIKPWLLQTATGGLVALGLWAAVGTGLSAWQHHHLVRQDAEIIEAKLAYDRVRADLEAYRTRVGALARGILDRQRALEAGEQLAGVPAGDDPADDRSASDLLAVDLEELAEISARIEGAFDRIATDLDLSEADRQRIVQSRDALHARIRTLEAALSDSRSEEARLETRAARLKEQRDRAVADYRDADKARVALSEHVETLSEDLAATDRREQALRGRVTALADALESAERETRGVEQARDSLKGRLAQAEDDLEESRSARRAVEQRVDRVVRDLAALSQSDAEADRDAVAALEVQASAIVEDLHRARRRVDAAENTLAEVVLGLARVAQEAGAVQGLAALDVEASGQAASEQLARIAPQAGGAGGDPIAGARLNADPVGQAEALLTEIEGLHDNQRQLVARLMQETVSNLSKMESLLRLAGLDVDAMLTRVGFEGGQGGPMVEASAEEAAPESPAAAESVVTDSFANEVDALEGRINRWRALQRVVKCVPLVSPVDNYHVTSVFGKRKDPINGRWSMHEGVDLGGWPGIAIKAAAPGTVTSAGRDGGYGKKVVIDHGCGVRTIYGHMRSIDVKRGQTVDHRETIGKLGSTGRSTGPHVHYEIQVDGKPLDPLKFIEAGKYVFKID